MPASKNTTRRRKSILQRLSLKPLLGRLRRKSEENQLRSPTSVVDVFHEQQQVDDRLRKELISDAAHQEVHIETPSISEDNDELRGGHEIEPELATSSDDFVSAFPDETGASAGGKVGMLRDFVSPKGHIFVPTFQRLSPLSWGSTSMFSRQTNSEPAQASTTSTNSQKQISASSAYFTPINVDDDGVSSEAQCQDGKDEEGEHDMGENQHASDLKEKSEEGNIKTTDQGSNSQDSTKRALDKDTEGKQPDEVALEPGSIGKPEQEESLHDSDNLEDSSDNMNVESPAETEQDHCGEHQRDDIAGDHLDDADLDETTSFETKGQTGEQESKDSCSNSDGSFHTATQHTKSHISVETELDKDSSFATANQHKRKRESDVEENCDGSTISEGSFRTASQSCKTGNARKVERVLDTESSFKTTEANDTASQETAGGYEERAEPNEDTEGSFKTAEANDIASQETAEAHEERAEPIEDTENSFKTAKGSDISSQKTVGGHDERAEPNEDTETSFETAEDGVKEAKAASTASGPRQPTPTEAEAGNPKEGSKDSQSETPEGSDPETLFKNEQDVFVDIVKGSYKKYKRGKITDLGNKTVRVLIDGVGEKTLWRTSLEFNGQPFPVQANNTKPDAPPHESQYEFKVNERVDIVGGTYGGLKGTVRQVKTRIHVLVDGADEPTWLKRESLTGLGVQADTSETPTTDTETPNQAKKQSQSKAKSATAKRSSSTRKGASTRSSRAATANPAASALLSEEEWRMADSKKGSDRIGLRTIVRTKLQLAPPEDTLLSHWLQGRLRVVEIPLTKAELTEEFPKTIEEEDGSKFELIVSKIQSDAERLAPAGAPSLKCIHLHYCQVEGPGLQPISLQEELERIADFGSLNPVKVCPRLELFVSPAQKFPANRKDRKAAGIFVLKQSTFGEIQENGNEGCGFISKDLLIELLGNGAPAKRANAIQVRGFASFGMYKGMLVAKAIQPGQPAIQIPKSMIVVGPSTSRNPEQNGVLMINRNGIHPNSTNEMLHRLFKPEGKGITKTFRKEQAKKKVSDMIVRLWRGQGIPKETCDAYSKQCKNVEKLEHAFVVGLADPTGQLPHGTVFIPGLEDNLDGDVFITRAPCLESSDGRKIPVVVSKPPGMCAENWDLLKEFGFGSIIFSNPKPGMTPMPVLIADGDLDGDLYFICWHKPILQQVKTESIDSNVPYNDSKKAFEYRDDWLSSAQERMIDAETTQKLAQIIGKLYNKAKALAEEDSSFLGNEDYQAFAHAYKESLKIGKHGGKVPLPSRLHNELPAKFHDVLIDA